MKQNRLYQETKTYKDYCKKHGLKVNDFKSLEQFTKPSAKVRKLIDLIQNQSYVLTTNYLVVGNAEIRFSITTYQYQELVKRGY